MIIMCEDCGKKYRIDPDRITGPQGRFKCKNCGNPIVVSREALKRVVRAAPPVEPPVDEAPPPPGTMPEPPAPGPPESAASSTEETAAGFDATSLWKGSDAKAPPAGTADDEALGFDPEAARRLLEGLEQTDLPPVEDNAAAGAGADEGDVSGDLGFDPDAARRLLEELSQVELSGEEGSDLGKRSGLGLGAPPPLASQKGAGFTPKIIFLLLLVSLAPLAVFGAVSLWQAKTQLGQSAVELNAEASTALTRQVDEWVDKNVRAMRAFAAIGDMASMDPAKQTPLLNAFAGEYPWVYLAFTVGPTA